MAAGRRSGFADVRSELALCLREWRTRRGGGSVIVAGWAMDNMKPRDFILSIEPLLDLEPEAEDRLTGLILAAEAAAIALREALKPVIGARGGEALEAERESFFMATEVRFAAHLATLHEGGDPRSAWLAELRAEALKRFDALATQGLDQRESDKIRRIVDARKFLGLAFSGHSKQGKAIFNALDMPLPEKRKRKTA